MDPTVGLALRFVLDILVRVLGPNIMSPDIQQMIYSIFNPRTSTPTATKNDYIESLKLLKGQDLLDFVDTFKNKLDKNAWIYLLSSIEDEIIFEQICKLCPNSEEILINLLARKISFPALPFILKRTDFIYFAVINRVMTFEQLRNIDRKLLLKAEELGCSRFSVCSSISEAREAYGSGISTPHLTNLLNQNPPRVPVLCFLLRRIPGLLQDYECKIEGMIIKYVENSQWAEVALILNNLTKTVQERYSEILITSMRKRIPIGLEPASSSLRDALCSWHESIYTQAIVNKPSRTTLSVYCSECSEPVKEKLFISSEDEVNTQKSQCLGCKPKKYTQGRVYLSE